MNAPLMASLNEISRLGEELSSIKLLHEQQTQSLLAARIEAKLVADELDICANDYRIWGTLNPLISRLRKIAEGK